MPQILSFTTTKWVEKAINNLISGISFIVFVFLDLLDILLCYFYRFIDGIKEENGFSSCYCNENRGNHGSSVNGDEQNGEIELSETLYKRKNIFKVMGFLDLKKEKEGFDKKDGLILKNRWSDCDCESCLSWQKLEDMKLHVVVKEPSEECLENENVIFLHGFLSSSSFWTESVFPNLSENGKQNFRLFAVDLLGFGKSPKPWDCLYTMKDHLEMVERSVINKFQLGDSFHIVAHSMGCIIALALASKYKKSVKTITLIAPPYFSSSKEKASLTTLNRVAERRLWPPLLFGSSVMSWYEHLGRSICFFICRNHRTWEWLLKLLTRKRELPFMLMDLTRHTHHSAWHTMHNVICGGAKLMDDYLEAVNSSEIKLIVIQGDKDQVVPLECIDNVKMKVPLADVKIIANANHNTVLFGRELSFTRDLEHTWLNVSKNYGNGLL